jgi:hypothetical protein
MGVMRDYAVISEPTSEGEIAQEAVREELSRILKSSIFVQSDRLGRFLRYTVETTLAGGAETLKEKEVAELKALFDADYRTIVLDLRDVRLADRDAVKFLRDCEADGIKLENCPAYVREWMEREKN